jgi:hypothetical protein
MIYQHVATDGPAQLLQSPLESRQIELCLLIVGSDVHQHADASHPLLRAGRKQPRCGCAANHLDEIAPLHCLPQARITLRLAFD